MAEHLSQSGERKIRARPPSALVLRSRRKAQGDVPVDWSRWYVTDEEDMGESPEQDEIIKLLRSCLDELSRERHWKHVLVGADVFFAWVPKHPLVRVSPDVYLLDNPPRKKTLPRSWQTWLPGVNPPRFAVEIVSVSWKKDYVDGPQRYAQLGCRELVIFDPTAVARRRAPREALTIYRKQEDGAFLLVDAGPGPFWSEELQASLVVIHSEDGARLRVSRDREGKDLVPTSAERAEAEARLRAEEARLRAEEARLRAEEARLRTQAEQRVAQLEAELARLKAKRL